MLVVRGTKKLRDRVRSVAAVDADHSTTMLGDWFATALFWKPQVALLVNERTLLPLYVPLAPAAMLLDRVPDAIASLLRRHGVDEEVIASELAAMSDTRIAPTNNRSIVGVMNEFAFQGEVFASSGLHDLEDLSVRMSELLLGPLLQGNGSPDRELAALLGTSRPEQLPSNVIPFPGTYHPDHPDTTDRTDRTDPPHSSDRTVPPPSPTSLDSGPANVYRLKATLQGVKPPVWRRVLVDGASSLGRVHEVFQAAFGWWNYHLHEFEIGDRRYGMPDPDDDWGMPIIDESNVRLDSVASERSTFNYMYDFGDGWEHRVVVEKVLPFSDDMLVPACIAGRRACPPEDCGGPWGYKNLLAILADPRHRAYRGTIDWIGRPFDPDVFDPADFDKNLRERRLAVFDD